MDGETPQSKREDESPTEIKDAGVEKKSLSRSSTSDCDEWVLVNALGNEVEHSGCQANQDVGTAANFIAPVLNNAAASLSIDLKPSANAYCVAVVTAEVLKEEPEEEFTSELEEPPTAEVTSAVSFVAPTPIPADATVEQVTTEFSRAEEKTIKRDESSEVSSQISILDHNEDVLSSPEGRPSSMASSTASTDFGGYEMVSSVHSRADQTEEQRDEDETTLHALEDALPVNFVEACSNRIRNYIHAYDLALNWKLSLLVVVASAAVLGLGLGHFIGSTHVWLSRQSTSRQQENQLQILEGRLIECLNRLQQAETSMVGDPSSSGGCKDGYCRADEKPTCPAHGDFETRLSGCLERLETCQNRLNAAEEAHKKRSNDMINAFRDLRLLRQNLMHVHATYEKLSALMMAERQQLQNAADASDSKRLANEQALEELSQKLKEAESREEKLINQEVELRRILQNLESTVGALNAELAKPKSQDKEGGASSKKAKLEDEGATEEDEDSDEEEAANTDFNWNRISELFEQLKDTTKFNEVFETYFDLFKDLKLPEINISKIWLDQLPASLEEMATTLKKGLEEKVRDVEETLYSTDWDQYVQKAKDVTGRVGDTVGTLWEKAKDLSEQVREQHGKQGEKILKDIKSTVEKAAEAFDKRWEQATRFWRDVVGSGMEEDMEEELDSSDAFEEDDGKDQVWIYEEGNNEEKEKDESEGWIRDENDVKENPESAWTATEGGEEAKIEKLDVKKYSGADAAAEVKQLREALKSSSVFSRYVTDEFADHYFRRLKQASRALVHDTGDYSAWWLCQKLWWARHSFAYGRQCSDKLMTWQRHVRVDMDIRQKLIDETPQLKSLAKKFASEEMPKLQDGTNWVFEWAKNRQEMRREDEQRKKNDDKKSWMDERWRSRDQMRRQDDLSAAASKWLFRRGKEREKKRGEEHQSDYWQRRTRASGKESSKKHGSSSSQRHRR